MADLNVVFVDLDEQVKKFAAEWSREFVERVKQKTPVVSGFLRDSWYTKTYDNEVEIGNSAPYASYVEYGTLNMEPRAMMQTTLLEKDDISKVATERTGIKP